MECLAYKDLVGLPPHAAGWREAHPRCSVQGIRLQSVRALTNLVVTTDLHRILISNRERCRASARGLSACLRAGCLVPLVDVISEARDVVEPSNCRFYASLFTAILSQNPSMHSGSHARSVARGPLSAVLRLRLAAAALADSALVRALFAVCYSPNDVRAPIARAAVLVDR